MIIWLASYPKSGNTWVRSFISTLMETEDGNSDLRNLKSIPQYPTRSFFSGILKNYEDMHEIKKKWIPSQDIINLDNKVKFFKTHHLNCKVDEYEFTNLENTQGVIHIVRDPRNVITSIKNHYHINDFEGALKFILNEKNCIGFAKNNKITENVFPTIISSWKSHYNSWKKVNKNYLLIKYENLLNNPETEFKKISSYVSKFLELSFDETKILNSIKTNSFENLKRQEEEGKFNEKVADEMSKKDFFYLGKRNNWRELLNKNYIDEINREFNTEMKELGYI